MTIEKTNFLKVFRLKDSFDEKQIIFALAFSKSMAKVLISPKKIDKNNFIFFENAVFSMAKAKLLLLETSEASIGEAEEEIKENIALRKEMLNEAKASILQINPESDLSLFSFLEGKNKQTQCRLIN